MATLAKTCLWEAASFQGVSFIRTKFEQEPVFQLQTPLSIQVVESKIITLWVSFAGKNLASTALD